MRWLDEGEVEEVGELGVRKREDRTKRSEEEVRELVTGE